MRQGSSWSGQLSWQRQRQGVARGDGGLPIAASWVRASLPGPEPPPRQQTLCRESKLCTRCKPKFRQRPTARPWSPPCPHSPPSPPLRSSPSGHPQAPPTHQALLTSRPVPGLCLPPGTRPGNVHLFAQMSPSQKDQFKAAATRHAPHLSLSLSLHFPPHAHHLITF